MIYIPTDLGIEEKIKALLATKFEEEEFQDCFLVELKLPTRNKLEVFLESDSGITHQKCKRISRYLESYLDSELWLSEHYTLEVSSPGIGKPLLHRRQYHKNIGRKVKVKPIEGNVEKGKLTAVTETHIVLEKRVEERVEGKKKKIKKDVSIEIPFENIEQTKVMITF